MESVRALSPEAVVILREADRKIQSLASGSHHLLYQFVRLTLSQIVRVDSFYVGYYCPGQEMIFPYSFDGQEYDDPEKFPYAEGSLSAWMLANKRPYQYAQDNGRLLNKGKEYGDTSRRSQDSIAVPLLEQTGSHSARVLGILSIQSYEPHSYTEESVQAFQWIADIMATALVREREDELRRSAFYKDPSAPEAQPRPLATIVEDISRRLKTLRNKVESIQQLAPRDHPALCAAINGLRQECEQSQTETIELLLRAVLVQESALPSLTAKQKEVFGLMVEGFPTGRSPPNCSSPSRPSRRTSPPSSPSSASPDAPASSRLPGVSSASPPKYVAQRPPK